MPRTDDPLRRLSNSEAKKLGFQDGFKTASPNPFSGMNQKDARYAIADQEFYWCENLVKIGSGKLRTLWDKGSAIYTAPGGLTIVYFFFYNLASTSYVVVFLSNGTAVQVDLETMAQTTITSVADTFYVAGGSLPACAQSGTKYLLISNNNTPNDYWIWNGSVLFTAGTLGPEITIRGTGYGYSSAPTITAYGGKGTGATFSATIEAGGIVQVRVTNPGTGYQPGDIVELRFSGGGAASAAQFTAVLTATTVAGIDVTKSGSGYTSAPTVVLTGGGGAGASATATVSGGRVVSVTVTSPGTGFSSAPTISFTGGGGTGASARAFLTPTSVTSVSVTQGGTLYNLPPTITLDGGGGTGAQALSKLTGTTVASFEITSPGAGYESEPSVEVDSFGSGGTGSTASSTVGNAGEVVRVNRLTGGSGYLYPPRVELNGGNPTEVATARALLTPTSVGTTQLRNNGADYTDAPTVIVDPGFNTAAYASAEVMPFGVSGSAMETFQSRVWLAFPCPKTTTSDPTGGTILMSTAGSLTNFSPSDGGVLFVNSQPVLRKQYNAIRQANGYLYPLGDSSVDVIANVQTSGDPATTTFNFNNTDPQTGTAFRESVQDFGRTVVFANTKGVFGLYGGAVTKISEKLDGLFADAIFPEDDPAALVPSACVAFIHNIKFYCLSLTITDPFTETPRNVLLLWDGKDWFVGTQSGSITQIGTRIVNSDARGYGTDGTSLYQLFTTPSTSLAKVLSSKLYGIQDNIVLKQGYLFSAQGQDHSADVAGAAISVVLNTEVGNITQEYVADLANPKMFYGGIESYSAYLGVTLGSTSPDFSIYSITLGYGDFAGAIGALDGLNQPAV